MIYRKIILALLLIICFLGSAKEAGAVDNNVNILLQINKGTNQLGYYENGLLKKVFPVATGREAGFTPDGKFYIAVKLINPGYYKLNIPGGAPNNPLGPRWMGLSAGNGEYGIHGNDDPGSIGTYASSGCVRMNNQDAIWLYNRVTIGTPVDIFNRPEFDLTAELPENKPITVKVNGRLINFPDGQFPRQQGGIILLPFKPMAKALGYKVTLINYTNLACLNLVNNWIQKHDKISMLAEPPVTLFNPTFIPAKDFNAIFNTEVYFNQENRELDVLPLPNRVAINIIKKMFPPSPLKS